MPSRRFHYTGRQRVLQTDITIRLSDETPPTFFVDKCSLDRYNLPPEAEVYIEAYRQMSHMRFHCGTVGELQLPDNPELGDFDSYEGIKFRIKVTASGTAQLLAEADGIADPGKDSLLPVKPSDLGHEIFQIDFSGEPLLLINDKLGSWKETTLHSVFISLAYPSVLRTILTRILLVEEESVDMEDMTDWRSRCLLFGKRHSGVSDPPFSSQDLDAIQEWIEEAVSGFSKQNNTYAKFIRNWNTGD